MRPCPGWRGQCPRRLVLASSVLQASSDFVLLQGDRRATAAATGRVVSGKSGSGSGSHAGHGGLGFAGPQGNEDGNVTYLDDLG